MEYNPVIMLGQRIAHYEIEEVLGEGGMGVVYRARDVNLNRQVAIKFLQPRLWADESERERLIQEARAASSLDHPNICTIYEADTAPGGQTFIVMAYYDGETLRSKLARKALTIDEALTHAIDIAQGLAKAHSLQMVHRDIKPDNIAITRDGVAKILDFGLVKHLHGAPQSAAETFTGTIAYMAPEQIEGRSDRRTDLWSLGVVIYEMMTGRLPFTGSQPADMLRAIASAPYAPATNLPAGVEKLIARALAKDPLERFQRAEEMLAHLHALRHNVEILSPDSDEGRQRRLNSIAVLPFSSLSGDTEAEYFGDGLADEIIHLLSQIRGMLVVAHGSSFEFKGKNASLREIGKQLNVSTILGGSVRRIGNKLRVTAELTDAVEGFNLWSRRYDRELRDIFAIQEDIALSIVSTLKANPKGEATPPRSRYAGNVEAHSLYLKGRFYSDQRTGEGVKKSGECFQQAIAIDPQCAPAYAGLADFYISLGFWGVMPPPEAWSMGRDFAFKSLQIDPRLPEAEISMARLAMFADWDWASAEQGLLRAIEIEPSLSTGHFSYAVLLIQLAQFEAALLEFRCARELDPLSLTVNTGVAWAYYYAGKFEQAIEECQRTFGLRSDYFEALGCMGLVAIGQGRLEEAVTWFERAIEAEPIPLGRGFLGYAYALSGRNEDARAILGALEAAATTRYVTPIASALIHIGLGEWDEAMTCLEKAWKLREAFMVYLRVFPPFKPLHGLPRYRALLHEIASTTDSDYVTI